MAETEAYRQAAGTGKYDKPSGLLGKYDNVRRFWEDQLTALYLAPSLSDLVDSAAERGRGLRILDLGCGSGDGFELFRYVPVRESDIVSAETSLITEKTLERYVGVDINDDLICQAEACFGGLPGLQFIQGDLSEGLPRDVRGFEPFDVYFAGYGTLSHFHDDQSARIIADLCAHAPDGAIFVGDWLGRYSYEWQDLWDNPVDQEFFMDYRISYIYPKEERDKVDVLSFPLRLMTRGEVEAIVKEAESISGATIRPIAFFDRSIPIGRHMETGDYNRHCPPLRSAVNSLFEQYRRTDLGSLSVEYNPCDGFQHLDEFFTSFFNAWNDLVRYTGMLLECWDPGGDGKCPEPDVPDEYPAPVFEAMNTMRQVVEGTARLEWCDARGNLIEPALGYCLRKLEHDLQPGSGMGHGFVGVFEIRK